MVQDKSLFYKTFTIFNYFLLLFLCLICIIPMINIIAISLSHGAAVSANKVFLWPIGTHIQNYTVVIKYSGLIDPFVVSVKRVIIGVIINLLLIVITAYPLSREPEEMKFRNIFMWIVFIPMLFGGGLIPTYLLIRNIGLLDKFWVLVLPGAVQVWSVIMMMNFFRRLPNELYEAAYIDGAGHMTILFKIFIPISKPAIATLALFSMVGHWNSWFDGIIYMNHFSKMPLQSAMQIVITQASNLASMVDMGGYSQEELERLSDRSLIAAQIVFTTLPILFTYPFLQKYFIKGIVIGAVKG